jgi:hypothetical protein
LATGTPFREKKKIYAHEQSRNENSGASVQVMILMK